MRLPHIVIGMGILLALPACRDQTADQSAVAEETGTTGTMEGGGAYPTAAPSDAAAPMDAATGDVGTSSAGATSSAPTTDAGGSSTTSGSGQP